MTKTPARMPGLNVSPRCRVAAEEHLESFGAVEDDGDAARGVTTAEAEAGEECAGGDE